MQAFFYWNDVTGDEPLRGTPEPAQDGLGGGVVALLDGEGGGGDDAISEAQVERMVEVGWGAI